MVVLTMVSYTVYAERRVSALIQDRVGPNRVGIPMTLLGFKKDFCPFSAARPADRGRREAAAQGGFHAGARQQVLLLDRARVSASSAVIRQRSRSIPFGSTLASACRWSSPMSMSASLFVFAISSLGVYGIVLAGWSSNSKYPFLGGIRSSFADDLLRARAGALGRSRSS